MFNHSPNINTPLLDIVRPSVQFPINSPPILPPPDYHTLINECNGYQCKIEELLRKYEIDRLYSEKFPILKQYNIVFLIDDYGYMNTQLEEGPHKTRYDELKSVIKIVVEISAIFNDDGIDIYFLNRDPVFCVNSTVNIDDILKDKPHRQKRLTECCSQIFSRFNQSENPVLFVIATGSVPIDECGNIDISNFSCCINNRNIDNINISLLSCSYANNTIAYLNKYDNKEKNVDTLDDYLSEKKKIINAHGSNCSYSLGHHTARLLIAPLFPEIGCLYESKFQGCKSKKRCIII